MQFIPSSRPGGRPVYVPSLEAQRFAGRVMGWLAIVFFVVALLLILP